MCVSSDFEREWSLVFLNASVTCTIPYFFRLSPSLPLLFNVYTMAEASDAIKNHMEIRTDAATFIKVTLGG